MLQSLADFASEPLLWKRTGWSDRSWELSAESAVLGTLAWPNVFSRRAEAETDTGRWELTRKGVFSRRIVVTDLATGRPAGECRVRWTGRGVMRFANGREMPWQPLNFWRTRWAFLEHGRVFVEFGRGRGVLRRGHAVTVARDAWRIRELPILVAVGLYHLVLMARAQHAAAAGG